MALPVLLLLLNILNFVMAVIVIYHAVPVRKLPSVKWMLLLVVSFCVVSFCTLGAYISRDMEVQIIFYRLRLLSLGLLPPCWFVFILSIYGKWEWVRKSWILFVTFIPGLVTTVLTIMPSWSDLVIKDFSPVIISSFSLLKYSEGAWFPFHYTSAMVLIFLSVIFGIYFFLQERGVRRWQVVILVISSSLAAGIDIYSVLTNSPLRWLMLSSGTFFFCQLGIVLSAWKLNLLNFLPLAMDRVFEEFPDPVVIIDRELKLRAYNRSMIDYLGPGDRTGENFYTVFPEIQLTEGEVQLIDRFGRTSIFQITIEDLNTTGHASAGSIIFFKSITVYKSIEKRLQENLEFKARLLALVSHDLAGQIEGQTLIMASLKDELNESSLRERVELAASSAIASQGFVENIISWVKGQGSNFELVCREFEWGMLIRECCEELEFSWKPKRLKIEYSYGVEPLIGFGDSNMLTSVLRNIISNAIRASAEGGVITISLSKTGDHVFVTVKDNGAGMNADQLDIVRKETEDYSFGSDLQNFSRGYGIGLKIARYFLKLHHAEFFISSVPGKGSEVSFRIPVTQEPGKNF